MRTQTVWNRFLRRRAYDTGYQLFLIITLGVLCLITVAPFVWVLLTAFKPNPEIYTADLKFFPQAPTLEHFRTVIEKGDQLPRYIYNTLVYSAATIAAVTLFSAMAGYALGMIRYRGAQFVITFVLAVLSIPWIILVVPLLLFEIRLEIWNTRLGLILPYIALFLPMGIWIMRGTFLDMPGELGDAARVDGASEFWVFWRVYLPMAGSGVATVALLTFIDIWNEVLLAASLVNNNPAIANINIGLRNLADEGQSFAFGTLSAAILLAMIPSMLVFVVLQRYYVRGITEGALTGM